MRISLIGTVHAESGRANVAVLQAILDRLQPETIFAEISANSLPEYLDGSDGNLESRAVAVYRKQHLIDVEPVDSKKPRDEFFRESQEMFEKVERTSLVYRRLLDQHSLYTRNHGFTYLNSDRCAQVWMDIYQDCLQTIEWIGDPRLRKIYARWRVKNDLRESAMLESIERYCSDCTLSNGALLVGAAHRKSLVEKIGKGLGANAPGISWDCEISLE